MIISIEAEVDDSFEKGECFMCPFSLSEDYENFHCVLCYGYDECPIKVVKKND